ncbi:MAG: radical SAM protein [Elusimicrobia bacterium]|nr:radical SAM protein [Elusimicrobiota bacterium]
MLNILLIRCNERLGLPARETNSTGIYPPLGLAYIAAALRQAGFRDIRVLDAHALGLSWEQFHAFVLSNPADVVLFTAATLVWPNIVKAARLVKAAHPSCLVGAGGPQLGAYPEESLACDDIDFGIRGEGETAVVQALQAIASQQDLGSVEGAVFRKDGKIVTRPAAAIQDLDAAPFPAVDLLPRRAYRALNVDHPFFSMVTSRGCPFACKFCAQIHSDQPFRMRSAGNVVDEMELYVRRYAAREIIVFDETFTVDRQRVLDICREIGSRGLRFRWNIRTRVDTVDEDMLAALRQAGCRGLHMGVESGAQEILDAMRKGITLAQVKKAFQAARRLGFETRGYFMLAYPGETLETIRQTLALSRELDLDWASFTITIPNPGTALCGDLAGDYWRDYVLGRTDAPAPFFTTAEYTAEALCGIRGQAYRDFYLRPGFILGKLFSRNGWRLLRNIVYNAPSLMRVLP